MKKYINVFWVIFTFLFVLILWFTTWYLSMSFLDEWKYRGTFGDMFGSINALFSGLAFAGVIIALYMQKKELSLQRAELEQTREELKGQKEQLELQNQNISRQNFENTYFNLVKLHHEYVSKIYIPGFGVNNQGRNSFEEFVRKYNGIRQGNINIQKLKNEFDKIIEVNKQFKKDYPSYIDIYIQNIFNILKFIIQSKDIDNKDFYSDLFSSQLSVYELQLINYFSIDPKLDDYFRSLLGRFSILNKLPKDEVLLNKM